MARAKRKTGCSGRDSFTPASAARSWGRGRGGRNRKQQGARQRTDVRIPSFTRRSPTAMNVLSMKAWSYSG